MSKHIAFYFSGNIWTLTKKQFVFNNLSSNLLSCHIGHISALKCYLLYIACISFISFALSMYSSRDIFRPLHFIYSIKKASKQLSSAHFYSVRFSSCQSISQCPIFLLFYLFFLKLLYSFISVLSTLSNVFSNNSWLNTSLSSVSYL